MIVAGETMGWRFSRGVLTLGLAAACLAQIPGDPRQLPGPVAPDKDKLPNGKSQREEVLKAEYQQNLKDADRLVDLSRELKRDLEKNDRYVLSLDDLKKTDDIEKLAKKIRSRMRRD
ncbi:MAG: hypothetical protein ABSH45_16745 [Bryobacteraceae bacterium]|jgi:hypothetical protein